MAVAVKNNPQTASARPSSRLAFGSFLGALYVLAAVCLVFFGVPTLWWKVLEEALVSANLTIPPFLNAGLFLIVSLAVIAGLCLLGRQLAGPSPAHGYRAGVFWWVFLIVLAGLLVQIIGVGLENWFGNGVIIVGVAVVLSAAVVYFMFRSMFRPSIDKWLGQLEDQGWFTTKGYKASQGLKVRRGTILGILILGGCGIYTLTSQPGFTAWPEKEPFFVNWMNRAFAVDVPFLPHWMVVLLPGIKFTVPLLLSVGLLWLGWRVVNLPVFADFLIATEAEINKVSWTTRRRLVQDSIVVLATVFLMTMFLLIVDILWFKILSAPRVQVLRIDTSGQKAGPASEKPDY